MIRIQDAIRSLIENPPAYTVDNGVITGWDIAEEKTNIPQPTDSEIQAEIDRLQADYDAKQYQRDRQYPSIGDQLDMQYWDAVNGTTTWKDAIAQVKADNPKPQE